MYKDAPASDTDWKEGSAGRLGGSLSASPKRDIITLGALAREATPLVERRTEPADKTERPAEPAEKTERPAEPAEKEAKPGTSRRRKGKSPARARARAGSGDIRFLCRSASWRSC
jgi:hypothetical protein